MEFLKEHLGKELYSQVKEKLQGNSNIKLANLKRGEYVSRAKYNELMANFNELKIEQTEYQKNLKQLEDLARKNKDQQKMFKHLQQKYEDDIQAIKTQWNQMKINHQVELAIVKSGAIDDIAVKAHLSSWLENASLDQNGILIGLKEQIEHLKINRSYLFASVFPSGKLNFTDNRFNDLNSRSKPHNHK